MNRILLRAPKRCQEVFRVLPSIPNSAIPRHTFITSGRVRTLMSSTHYSLDNPPSSHSTPSSLSAEDKETPTSKPASESSQHVPWYLQEESPIPAATEVSSRDQLPELPENPPKILPILLEYVFKDLGLDELKLIDLRGLETPPALGANVIMIIGTARSVKHLNVSADRLCRWLRSNWKLSPYADGLLGRNELKIKLRRRIRRARLASRTGALVDDKDDGITTGWICVNAGVVEKGPVQEQPDDDSFEGFGHLGAGTRVVVQLFTEEKRAELDLEGLWEANLARAKREKQRHSSVSSDAPEEVRCPNSICPSPSDYGSPHVPRSSVSLPLEHRRQFHTKPQHQDIRPRHNFGDTGQRMSPSGGPGEFPKEARSNHLPTSSLLQSISDLPDEQIRIALGDGPDDHGSTEFLQLFYGKLSGFSNGTIALAQAELMCLAGSRKHPGYSKESLHRTIMGCFISACLISDHLASQVVTCLLAPRTGDDPELGEWLPDSDKELALSVLDQFALRGMNVMTMGVFNKLYSAASLPSGPGEHDISPADRGSHVLRMIETLNIPFHPVQARELMLSLFRNGDYDGFWKWWRRLPLNNSTRVYEDYEMLFWLHAELGDERRAQECLTTWAPMMRREEPPIFLEGGLLHHVMHCLILADPRVEYRAEEGSQSLFAQLWRECVSKMEE